MTDTPKFTVVDRRKFRADDESSPETPATVATPTASPATADQPSNASPRLTIVESANRASESIAEEQAGPRLTPVAVADLPEESAEDFPENLSEDSLNPELPPPPTPEEASFQRMAYDKAAGRLEDLIRAQNPAAPQSEKIGFEHLVQQLYLSAMMQMGAGTPEGQRPRIDILGARQTIDLLTVLASKTGGNLSQTEERMLETVLFEVRTTFLELTRMISAPKPPVPPPGAGKR